MIANTTQITETASGATSAKTGSNRLGNAQRCVLHDMRLYSANNFGAPWTAASRRVMASLHARGLVTTGLSSARLTPVGERVADRIITQVWGREPILAAGTIVLVTGHGPEQYGLRCGQHSTLDCHRYGHVTLAEAQQCAREHVEEHRSAM